MKKLNHEIKMTDYTLTYGSHVTREDGMCLMEAVAYLAGEPHTDAPACACPVLTAYAIRINDEMGKGLDGDALRARYLHGLAPMLVGSRSTPEVEQARVLLLADHAVRVIAPLALESAGLHGEAKRLRTLDAVIDRRAAKVAKDEADTVAKGSAYCTEEWEEVAYYVAAYAAYCAHRAEQAAYCTYLGNEEAARMPAGDAAARAAGATARYAVDSAGDAAWDAAVAALVAALEVAP